MSKSGLYFIKDIKYSELTKYYKYFINLKSFDFKIIECLNTEESIDLTLVTFVIL